MSVLDRPVLPVSDDTAQALRRLFSLTFALALVAFAILLPVVQSSDEAAQGYRIRALEQQKSDLDAQIYAGQAKIAQLGALARIDNEARNRLGMVPASDVVAVTVDVPQTSDQVTTTDPRAAAEPAPPPARTSPWVRFLRLIPHFPRK